MTTAFRIVKGDKYCSTNVKPTSNLTLTGFLFVDYCRVLNTPKPVILLTDKPVQVQVGFGTCYQFDMKLSWIAVSTIAVSTIAVSTIAGSWIAVSTIAVSTIAVSTIAVSTIALSTIAVSTIAVSTIAVSTIAVSTNVCVIGLFSQFCKFFSRGHWIFHERKYESLKYNQQDATFSPSIYFYKLLYMFLAVPPPIIRSTKLYIQCQVVSNQYCCLLLSWSSISSMIAAGSSIGLALPDAVCTVLCSWWWAEEPPETYRAIYRNK